MPMPACECAPWQDSLPVMHQILLPAMHCEVMQLAPHCARLCSQAAPRFVRQNLQAHLQNLIPLLLVASLQRLTGTG